MKSLVEAAIAILIVWLFIEYKNGKVHVASTTQTGSTNSFSENPSNGYGTPASLGTGTAPPSGISSGGGCGCGGGSATPRTINPNPVFPEFPVIVSAPVSAPRTGTYAGSIG